MTQKRFKEVLHRLEYLNTLRVANGKLPLVRFWSGIAHRLHTTGDVSSLNHYWLPGFFLKNEAFEAVIEVLIVVEQGNYK